MQLDTWKITGSAGFHFGAQGLGQEETNSTLSSDSLFSALAAQLAVSAGSQALAQFIQSYDLKSPAFVLSSTFPLAGSLRFFPPLARLGSGAPAKELKKVRFVSEGLFRQMLEGRTLADVYSGAALLQNKAVLALPAETASLPASLKNGILWQIEQQPQVALDRSSSASRLYFTGRVSFAAGCGLWFGLRWLRQDTAMADLLANLFVELGYSGLGGQRSSGFGACRIEPGAPVSLPDVDGGLWTNLSRYLPGEDEMSAFQHEKTVYRLCRVGGWLGSPSANGQRRKTLNLVEEGSVFGPLSRQAPGLIAEVSPSYPGNPQPLSHPVYRSGIALAVGVAN